MGQRFAEIAFTPAVQALQERAGSRAAYARMAAGPEAAVELGPREAEFLARADSFYLATVSETGWPYVQHRGGPPGFLRVLGAAQLGYADFRGNVQLVSAGNVSTNDRVALIVTDYARRQRLKLLGRLRFVPVADADPALVSRVEVADYRARIERVALIEVEAYDWNCPQHITPRYSESQVDALVAPLQARIVELEARLATAQAVAGG